MDLEILRPLLDSYPRMHGDVNIGGGKIKAICLSCGAQGPSVMIPKHKKSCAWKAHWRAVEALRVALEKK